MIEPQTLRFLTQLNKNNNKPWFDAHRPQYEAARIDVSNFVQLLIEALQKTDPTITGLAAKDCLFRTYRDVRFSKDKTPYKAYFGASIKRDGRKSPFAGYYLHIQPGQSFVGGGLWMPESPTLKNVRQEIDYNWPEFESILHHKTFKKIYGGLYLGNDVSLSNLPKGYEKDHPAATYLRLKSLIAETTIGDDELTKSSLHKKALAAFEALQPLLQFLNQAIA